ncbi:ABC transporter permease [Nucisporomicrobium flavum]|uniref:ABC transporter permease n=1 Tax=Nucisporomicrobium flavum TaxID=2785915 RepID=UPI0018F35505|nr:ABC transporter permease [Nucisporomicrobium flavum]
MSSLALAVRDSSTMLRRNLRHMRRYPAMTVMLAGMPVIFLLLFVFVFGGTLGAGLGGGRAEYLTYVLPGILLMTIGGAATGTSVSVAMDMTEGIVARFRTMAIARVSVLTGHVLGSIIQTLIGLVIVVGIAVAVGFRSDAGPGAWLGVLAVLTMVSFAFTWLGVALGMAAKTVEEASNTPLPLTLLPFLGSGFVPTDTMPAGLRQFAEYQPYTPIMETVRGLLAGTPVGADLAASAAWCAAIALAGYVWAKWNYNKQR